MDVQFYGANCLVISGKQSRIVIDDNLAELGAKTVAKEGDISLFTGPYEAPVQSPKLLVDEPGEYEVSSVSLYGIAARSHMDTEGQKSTICLSLWVATATLLMPSAL